MLQLKILHAATKTQHIQINKSFFFFFLSWGNAAAGADYSPHWVPGIVLKGFAGSTSFNPHDHHTKARVVSSSPLGTTLQARNFEKPGTLLTPNVTAVS